MQSLSLPGRFRRPDGGRLTRDLGLRRAARLARASREDDASDDRFRDRPVVIEPVLQRRTDSGIDGRQHLGIVQTILGLPLELRLLDEQAEHAGEAFADVFGSERDALGRQIVRLDVVPHRLADPARSPFSCVPPDPVGMPLT